jgi:hypothetical protein
MKEIISEADKLSIYSSTALLLDLGRYFSFLMLYTVGRTPCMGDQPVARPLTTHRTKHTDIHASSGIRTHDPSVRASEDRAASVIGS